MFVIFGTKFITEPDKPLLDTYCYNCNQHRTWDLYSHSEYFTLFFIPTFSFKAEHFLVCKKCNEQFDLDKELYKRIQKKDRLREIDSQKLHDELVAKLEKQQLANKTSTQIKFIKSIKRK